MPYNNCICAKSFADRTFHRCNSVAWTGAHIRDASTKDLVCTAGSSRPLVQVHNIPAPSTPKHYNDGKAYPAKRCCTPSTKMYTMPLGRSRKRSVGPLARIRLYPAMSWPGTFCRILFEFLCQCRNPRRGTCAGRCGPCGQRPA